MSIRAVAAKGNSRRTSDSTFWVPDPMYRIYRDPQEGHTEGTGAVYPQ